MTKYTKRIVVHLGFVMVALLCQCSLQKPFEAIVVGVIDAKLDGKTNEGAAIQGLRNGINTYKGQKTSGK